MEVEEGFDQKSIRDVVSLIGEKDFFLIHKLNASSYFIELSISYESYKYIISSPEQCSERAIVLTPASSLASANVKSLRQSF